MMNKIIVLLFLFYIVQGKAQIKSFHLPKGIDSTLIIDSFKYKIPNLELLTSKIELTNAYQNTEVPISIKVKNNKHYPIKITKGYLLDSQNTISFSQEPIQYNQEKTVQGLLKIKTLKGKIKGFANIRMESNLACSQIKIPVEGILKRKLNKNDQPVLSFHNTFVDLGNDFEYNTVYPFQFKFINSGNQPLSIYECTTDQDSVLELKWPKEEINPGKTGTINGTFKTGNGRIFRRYIFVESNALMDEEGQKLILVIKGRKTK